MPTKHKQSRTVSDHREHAAPIAEITLESLDRRVSTLESLVNYLLKSLSPRPRTRPKPSPEPLSSLACEILDALNSEKLALTPIEIAQKVGAERAESGIAINELFKSKQISFFEDDAGKKRWMVGTQQEVTLRGSQYRTQAALERLIEFMQDGTPRPAIEIREALSLSKNMFDRIRKQHSTLQADDNQDRDQRLYWVESVAEGHKNGDT